MPVFRRKQSDRLAAQLNSPPLTWMCALRGLAERDDAGIEAVDECAEGQEVQRAFLGDIQTFAHVVILIIYNVWLFELARQDSRMIGRCKVLFLKILQKSFVFLQKTANDEMTRGKILYNSPVFREIL